MYITIDTASGVPIYLQIINGIKYAIAVGSLKSGDQIPSVRELSSQLTINPNTVLKAIRELEHEKVITIKRGVGAFVSKSGISIKKNERRRIISEMLSKVISQAHHFKISDTRLHDLLQKELKKFKKS